MKAFAGIIWAIAIVLSTPLAGQETAPDKEHQKQEEPKKQTSSDRKGEGQPQEKPKPKPQNPQPAPVPPQQKPGQGQQPNRRGQQPARPVRGNGRRIPPESFQANFGSQHRFHVENLEGGRRFRHGGFLFEIVDAWPADWFLQDDCFIEQDLDDYYLVDVLHPNVRVLVIVIEG